MKYRRILRIQIMVAYFAETLLILNIFMKWTSRFVFSKSNESFRLFEITWAAAPLLLCAWVFYVLLRNTMILNEPDKLECFARYQDAFAGRYKVRSDTLWFLLLIVMAILMMTGFVSVKFFTVGLCAVICCCGVLLLIQTGVRIKVKQEMKEGR